MSRQLEGRLEVRGEIYLPRASFDRMLTDRGEDKGEPEPVKAGAAASKARGQR